MFVAVLYAVAQVFLLVWDRDMEGDEEHRNPFPLHSVLILTTLGSSFVMLALYRLVQVWREIGLKGGDSSMLRVAAPLGVAVSTVLSLVGDVILLRLDEEEHEDTGGIVWSSRKALLVKGVGSLVGLVLLLIYIALIVVTAVQQRRGRRGTADHQSLVPVLLVLGILAIVHWSYFAVVVLSSALPLADTSMDSDCNSGNWQLATGLIAAPDIVLLATAFLYDLTRVKNGAKVTYFFFLWVLSDFFSHCLSLRISHSPSSVTLASTLVKPTVCSDPIPPSHVL